MWLLYLIPPLLPMVVEMLVWRLFQRKKYRILSIQVLKAEQIQKY